MIGMKSISRRPRVVLTTGMQHVVRRKYDILQSRVSQPPSAVEYQLSKLQTLNSLNKSAKSGVFSRLHSLNFWCLRHPLMLATSMATVKAVTCDWIAQKRMDADPNGNNIVNYTRLSLFAAFGFCYVGLFQYGVYNKLYPLLFNQMRQGLTRNVANTMLDLTLHLPLITCTCYIFKGFLRAPSMSMDIVSEQVRHGFSMMKEDMASLYTVLAPALLFMFCKVPCHLRVPWISSVSIVWAIIISLNSLRLKRQEAANDGIHCSVDDKEVQLQY